ncbi:hypothetical protein [Pseudonocardia sp. TRM90224]|uniref:hypothetical protein n=1 Tax=Pseudonocardia sp. TRM90224 TaxID=2812678 RepID=UPI001E64F6A8|nr:hypothetical protein [Pseudonocardia sp. TRM90224]
MIIPAITPAIVRFTAIAVAGALLLAACGSAPPMPPPPPPPVGPPAPSLQLGPPPTSAPSTGHLPIPRTRVAIKPPDGMVVDETLPGLARTDVATTVRVIETARDPNEPAPKVVEQVAGGYRSEAQANLADLKVASIREVQVAGFPAVAVEATQAVQEGILGRAMVSIVSNDSIVLLDGTIAPGDPLTPAALLTSLLDARWLDVAAAGSLGFDLTPAAGFKRLPSSTTIAVSLDGSTAPGAPLLVASAPNIQAPIAAADRKIFAEQQLESLTGEKAYDSATPIEVSGLTGWEMLDRGPGLSVYLVVLFAGDWSLVLAGSFDSKVHPDQVPAFQTMARSVVLR